MSALPQITRATAEVALSDGQKLTVRGLTRAACREMVRLQESDSLAADAYVLSQATDTTVEEASAWLDACPPDDAQKVVKVILCISSLRLRLLVDEVDKAAEEPDPQP